ncbi:hypothetical protein LOC67_05935 [Stieleria sp. JC731]|uniref:hypothetical protein n=1 Tax=Pirellulaceae TaxID=2691357 RepID=UPI001E39D810|nr:hypothetical protein [Stieleria sp. JC731]MCC9600092.1 hypothetical protein [Stieleria sp. JC731]
MSRFIRHALVAVAVLTASGYVASVADAGHVRSTAERREHPGRGLWTHHSYSGTPMFAATVVASDKN